MPGSKYSSKSTVSVVSPVANLRPLLSLDMDVQCFKSLLSRELCPERLGHELSEEALEEIRRLSREKYASWEWTFGRNPRFSCTQSLCLPSGKIEVWLSVHEGRISDISFTGDYMARREDTELTDALKGCLCRREELLKVLSLHPVEEIFGGISAGEVAELILQNE